MGDWLTRKGFGEYMRKVFWLLLFLTIGLLTACGVTEPDIDVTATYDFGSINKGEVAAAEIPVRNLGNGELTVVAVSTSCGCTTAVLSPMTIPPGGEAMLRVAYDSAVHEVDIDKIERYVFISSDDPDEADVQIKFTVFVQADSST
jgi:hypothetical protein